MPEPAAFVPRIVHVGTVDSTMAVAESAARQGAPAGTTIVAAAQTRGRGRGGSQWASPPGTGLYLTCVLRPRDLADLPSLSLLVALKLTALGPAVGLPPLRVKWPNDLLGRLGKVGGLLLVCHGAGAERFVLVGLGLNLEHPGPLPDAAKGPPPLPASSLRGEGALSARLERQALANVAIAAIGDAQATWQADGFGPHAAAYNQAHALHGQWIVAEGEGVANGGRRGQVVGVAADGALMLETPTGPQRVRSATLRLAPEAPQESPPDPPAG